MTRWRWAWILTIPLMTVAAIYLFTDKPATASDSPWDFVKRRAPHVDHTDIMAGEYPTPQAVTQRCLECHEDAAAQVMQTNHWTWESEPATVEGHPEPVVGGKKNVINNFCIGIAGNWSGCSSCHTGYGWEDQNFDFSIAENVDCLVCHDQSGQYVKGTAGLPADSVDLEAVAQSVGYADRDNCGGCHFRGGGGDAVKHGDLDSSLFFPDESVDVHMGRYDFVCTDCHTTDNHDIKGKSISVSLDNHNQAYCTDCHNAEPHEDFRLNSHIATVACQTCHVPEVAVRLATKTHWDWSTAGDDEREQSTHEYLKIKGSFEYEKNLQPTYAWYNGVADRYILGDALDAGGVTKMNEPKGDIQDSTAKIWPFKVHLAEQPYDKLYNHLLQPKTVGEYWVNFDWDAALRAGSELTGLDYSGDYGFTTTSMHWPLTHMVAPKNQALSCEQCHSKNGRLDWQALGYPGDPIEWGGRANNTTVEGTK